MKRAILVFAFLTASVWAAENGFPTVRYKGGLLLATPAPDHRAESPEVQILESEECNASAASRTSIRVAGKCEFLKALFTYRHTDPSDKKAKRMFVGFTFSSPGAGHTLMVSGPFAVREP